MKKRPPSPKAVLRSHSQATSTKREPRSNSRHSVQIAFQNSVASINSLTNYFDNYPSKLLSFGNLDELKSIFKNNVADCSLNFFVVRVEGLRWLQQTSSNFTTSSNIIAAVADESFEHLQLPGIN